MTIRETRKIDWRCHLGRHHYVRRPDDNPEVQGATYQECTRCGSHEYGRPDGLPLGPRAAALAFAGTG